MESTQPSLLNRVRDPADQLAWREFEFKYGELILRYCRSHGLQTSDAEDVRQIVMLSLSRALRDFHYSPVRGRFRNYLGKVVRNAIHRQRQRPNAGAQRLDADVLALAPDQKAQPPDALWEEEWIRHHYRMAMQTVRKTYETRSVALFDRLLVGESVTQVAAEFAMSTQAVHKVKQRIRNRLEELIAAQIREEDDPGDSPTG
ncbi:MAG: sigma-70 family RNA polymerase sigma factor [Planctomycetota bacterium]